MKRVVLAVTILTAAAMQGEARSQVAAERDAVRAAVLDYVEAIYNAQPAGGQ